MADIDRHSGPQKLRDMPQESPEDVKMLGLFMDVGAMMIRNGSEVKRVEDTLRRMGAAYGAERMDVFAITSTGMYHEHAGWIGVLHDQRNQGWDKDGLLEAGADKCPEQRVLQTATSH